MIQETIYHKPIRQGLKDGHAPDMSAIKADLFRTKKVSRYTKVNSEALPWGETVNNRTNARSFILKFKPKVFNAHAFVRFYAGTRCGSFDPQCYTCQAWREVDAKGAAGLASSMMRQYMEGR